MKSANAAYLPDEHFVIRVDGRVKSHHRRFLDALREGLQLRDQFPQHDVKVQSMNADRSAKNCFALNFGASCKAAVLHRDDSVERHRWLRNAHSNSSSATNAS
jgi:hypothetical protein